MSIFFYYNDKLYKQGTPVISANNRSLRYGDGLFETMKVVDGKIILSDYHFERLFTGLQLLQFELPKHFTREYLINKIHELCIKNSHTKAVRIRLTIVRGDGGLYDIENNSPNWIIESWDIKNEKELNTNGLIIDVYPEIKKSCDNFSNVKSNNFLPYVMAALYAKRNKLNDAVLLNTNNRICDSTIANVFIIKDREVFTPPLSEGWIAGVTRRWLLSCLVDTAFSVTEKEITVEDLEQADELFITNSIFDMKWVQRFRDKVFTNSLTKQIHGYFIKSVY